MTGSAKQTGPDVGKISVEFIVNIADRGYIDKFDDPLDYIGKVVKLPVRRDGECKWISNSDGGYDPDMKEETEFLIECMDVTESLFKASVVNGDQ